MSDSEEADQTFKFLLVGDEAVGKTCIINRLVNDTFEDEIETTIGVDFFTHVVDIDGQRVRLQIWDTAGQEKYRSLGRAYYRNALGVFFVFSIASHKTFQNIESWYKEVIPLCHPKVQTAIIGNKCDIVDEREVSAKEANDISETLKVPFFETSAATGSGISEAFVQMARRIFTLVKTKEILSDKEAYIEFESDDEEKPKKSKGCCK